MVTLSGTIYCFESIFFNCLTGDVSLLFLASESVCMCRFKHVEHSFEKRHFIWNMIIMLIPHTCFQKNIFCLLHSIRWCQEQD